jgi:hypothetical protein
VPGGEAEREREREKDRERQRKKETLSEREIVMPSLVFFDESDHLVELLAVESAFCENVLQVARANPESVTLQRAGIESLLKAMLTCSGLRSALAQLVILSVSNCRVA